jgi:hypothetical protein
MPDFVEEWTPEQREQILFTVDGIFRTLNMNKIPGPIASSALMVSAAHACIQCSGSGDEEILAEFKKCLTDARIHAAGTLKDV